MRPLRILTVDDEPLALRRMKLLLRSIPTAELVGEASGCSDALVKVAELQPDVLLLDIRMRDGSGFDVVEAAAHAPSSPVVIFVTAFDEFAVRAFEASVADYLLKPVDSERLTQALARARQQLDAAGANQRMAELKAVIRNLRSAARESGSPYETEFWLRSGSGMVRVPVDAIDCVSSEEDYVAIHSPAGSHLMRSSIRQFEERVEPGLFIRVHRHWLVRRGAIAELRQSKLGRAEVVLRSGERVPAGRVYLKQLRQEIRSA
jgi:two-component system, LytTR family, response regulator